MATGQAAPGGGTSTLRLPVTLPGPVLILTPTWPHGVGLAVHGPIPEERREREG